MDCYFNDPEENKNAFSEDGFFKTGDLVRFDDEGFLFIVGRIKEIIVLSTGEKISPFDLENKFDELDIIQDSLVYLDEETNFEKNQGKGAAMKYGYSKLLEFNVFLYIDSLRYARLTDFQEETNKSTFSSDPFGMTPRPSVKGENLGGCPARSKETGTLCREQLC